MGARGPIAKAKDQRQNANPHALVVLDGSKQVAVPPPPKGLSKASRDRWAAFWCADVALAISPASDLGLLERWIAAWDEWTRIQPVLRKRPTVEGSQGQPVLNPLAAYAKQLEDTIKAAEAAFGMTPYARARLGLTVGQAKLTAAQLNALVNRGAHDDDAEFSEYEPA